MRLTRSFVSMLLLMLATLLAGCGVSRPPVVDQAPPVPTPIVLSMRDLVREPQRWSGQELTVVAPIIVRDHLRVLVPPGMRESDPSQSIWLAEPPPDEIVSDLDRGSGLARLTGRVSPPGAYGADQQYTYQFSATSIELLNPERTTIANLALNPHVLDGMALRLDGTLLAQPDGALLVDEVSDGGVPTAGAHEIKLDPAALDESVLADLQQSGDVRWGAVEIIGWWQNRALTPLSIVVRE